jgi:hypothetical protein
MTQEALRMALEALENGDVPTPENVGKNLDAITAIKEALGVRCFALSPCCLITGRCMTSYQYMRMCGKRERLPKVTVCPLTRYSYGTAWVTGSPLLKRLACVIWA